MTTMTLPPTSPPQAATERGRAALALVLSLLWLGGFGSIAAIVLARSAQRKRLNHGLDRSPIATAAILIGVLGLLACAFAAMLVVGAEPRPN